jgi:enoyl-CoA hydratase/carnithine racemase
MTDLVRIVHHASGVAEVILNRPEKMNALAPAMFDAIIDAGESLIVNSRVRAVVLRGEGRAFCAGLDLVNFENMKAGIDMIDPARLIERTHGDANKFQRVATVWRDIPVPVIAALHGVAFGGGLQIALGADLRLVTADTKISVMDIKWGLVPDMAGMLFMRQLVRADVARDLIYTGRVVGGVEAVQLGLATRVVEDPYSTALTMTQEMTQRSPLALRAAKRMLNQWGNASDADLLLAEADEQSRLIGRAEQMEAVQANIEKRPPVFHDPE